MAKRQITIEIRSVCGVQRAYPVCIYAHMFAALCGSRTLQDADLKIIQELGYTIHGLTEQDQPKEDCK